MTTVRERLAQITAMPETPARAAESFMRALLSTLPLDELCGRCQHGMEHHAPGGPPFCIAWGYSASRCHCPGFCSVLDMLVEEPK